MPEEPDEPQGARHEAAHTCRLPESFETERLVIRSPLPGDGPDVYAAVRESIEELSPWMAWPKEHGTVDDSEASVRRARVAFLARSELRLHL